MPATNICEYVARRRVLLASSRYIHKHDRQNEKILHTYMCTSLHYCAYVTFCVSYASPKNSNGFANVSSTHFKSIIDKLCLDQKLFNFKV